MKAMSWLFAFNLDAWEIFKVADNMTYKSVQDYSSDSSLMPFSYWHVLVAWAAFLAILAVAYLVAYIVLSKRDDPFLMVKISNMQRVYIIIIQVRLQCPQVDFLSIVIDQGMTLSLRLLLWRNSLQLGLVCLKFAFNLLISASGAATWSCICTSIPLCDGC